MQLEAVMRRAGDVERLQADEAADAVLDMDDDVAGDEARDLRDEIVELAARLARPHQAVAQNVLLADDGDVVGLEAAIPCRARRASSRCAASPAPCARR